MDYRSSQVKPEGAPEAPFDIQGFKNLLDTLKESKERQKNEVEPLYDQQE